MEFLKGRIVATSGILFAVWLVLCTVIWRLGFQPLKLVVMAGTFALAMAFASNDLVNFIGVPLAGLASYQAWQGSDVAAHELSMEMLAAPVRGETHWLLLAGLVMTVTLWLSAKARTVTDEAGDIYRIVPMLVEFELRDVIEIIVGACVLAIPVAFTEEVWVLGEQLPLLNVMGVTRVSSVWLRFALAMQALRR